MKLQILSSMHFETCLMSISKAFAFHGIPHLRSMILDLNHDKRCFNIVCVCWKKFIVLALAMCQTSKQIAMECNFKE